MHAGNNKQYKKCCADLGSKFQQILSIVDILLCLTTVARWLSGRASDLRSRSRGAGEEKWAVIPQRLGSVWPAWHVADLCGRGGGGVIKSRRCHLPATSSTKVVTSLRVFPKRYRLWKKSGFYFLTQHPILLAYGDTNTWYRYQYLIPIPIPCVTSSAQHVSVVNV